MNLPRRSVRHQENLARELVLLQEFGHRKGLGHGLLLRQSAAGGAAPRRLGRSSQAGAGADSPDRAASCARCSDVPPLSREFLHSLGISLLNDRRRETLERTGDVIVALATSNGGAAARAPLSPPRRPQPGASADPARGPRARHARAARRGARADRAGRGAGARGRRPRAAEDHHAGGAGR